MSEERQNVYDILKERGFVSQVTDEDALRKLFDTEQVTCYIGFDPTANSLHAGSLVPIMSLMHMQRSGHLPIAVIGGGTAMVGDPSGRTEMRQMLTREKIIENGKALKAQLSKYIEFDDGNAISVDNYDWLSNLNYIEFLRDIGRHFSVNRMLTAESYKIRLETGLSFIEFNYQLLQSYDFLMLYKNHNCKLQMGGDDQWGNIVAGVDLVRRVESAEVEGVTFPLLTTATGEKMGKTAKGALWLDAKKTSPYDFYQYWVNVDDRDVVKFLSFFTFLPMDEVRPVEKLTGADLNNAKAVLAYEATKITHGEDESKKALAAAASAFGARIIPESLLPSSTIPRGSAEEQISAVPTTAIEKSRFEEGIWVVALFVESGLAKSNGEARRLIKQGGAYLNEQRMDDADATITLDYFKDDAIMLRAGKKRYQRIVLK